MAKLKKSSTDIFTSHALEIIDNSRKKADFSIVNNIEASIFTNLQINNVSHETAIIALSNILNAYLMTGDVEILKRMTVQSSNRIH
jgi:hypothetical protein